MRITSKGQVTIPQAIREKAGLLPETEVEFKLRGKVVEMTRARRKRGKTRGERLVEHLRAFRSDTDMTADEVMKLTRGE
jgi:AbrB family looped-hinge helix DNA binding protein